MRTFYYLVAREGKSRKGVARSGKSIREEQRKAHPRLARELVHSRHADVQALGDTVKATAFD